MKNFTFILALTLTFAYVLSARDALPMIIAWALYAWVRQQETQAKMASYEDCAPNEELADTDDVLSDEPLPARPSVIPPPLP